MLLTDCNCAHAPFRMGKTPTGSAKKPLKVIIVLVIIAMCLTTVDGAPKHRKRHAKAHDCQHKLETNPNQRNRTKTKHATREYADRMHKIQNRLTYTLTVFAKEQSSRREVKPMLPRGKADWLPKVNFVDIVRNNHGGAVKRFELLVPKIYKNMKHFQAVFDCLQQVHDANIDSSDPQKRKRLILNHQDALEDLVLEAEDGMHEFNRCVPPVNSTCDVAEMERLNFHFGGNQALRVIQDELTFKAYSKSLKNWKRAFRCGLPSLKDKVFCRKWRQQFEQRRKVKKDIKHLPRKL